MFSPFEYFWVLLLGFGSSLYLTFKDRIRPEIPSEPSPFSCLVPRTDELFSDIEAEWTLPDREYNFFAPDGRKFLCKRDASNAVQVAADETFLCETENWIAQEGGKIFLCDESGKRFFDDVQFSLSPFGEILPITVCRGEKRATRKRGNRPDYEAFLVKRPKNLNTAYQGGDIFFECDGENFIESVQSCGLTAVFNDETTECEARDFCDGVPDGLIHSNILPDEDPLERDEYLLCYNGASRREKCRGGELFDWTLRRCREPGACFEREIGFTFQHPTDERKFYECQGSEIPVLRECEGSNVFSATYSRCIEAICQELGDGAILALPQSPWARSNRYRVCVDGNLETKTIDAGENGSFSLLNRLLRTLDPILIGALRIARPLFSRVFDERTGVERDLDPDHDLEPGASLAISRRNQDFWPSLPLREIGEVTGDGNVIFFDERNPIVSIENEESPLRPLILDESGGTVEERFGQRAWFNAISGETGRCEQLFNVDTNSCDNFDAPLSLLIDRVPDTRARILRELIMPRFLSLGDRVLRIINGGREEETAERYEEYEYAIDETLTFYGHDGPGPLLRSSIYRHTVDEDSYFRADLVSKEISRVFCRNEEKIFSSELPFCVPDHVCLKDIPALASRQFPDGRKGWSFYDDSLTHLIFCDEKWTLGDWSAEWNEQRLCEDDLLFHPLEQECVSKDRICEEEEFLIPDTMQIVYCDDAKKINVFNNHAPLEEYRNPAHCPDLFTHDFDGGVICLNEEELLRNESTFVGGRAAFYPSLWNKLDGEKVII